MKPKPWDRIGMFDPIAKIGEDITTKDEDAKWDKMTILLVFNEDN
jgi:hypothetical protein